jgi:hypothetical protein
LTAREFLSVLGRAGHHIEIVDPNPACICRFSRWTRGVHRCPAAGLDPIGYLAAVKTLLAEGAFDVLLPTHEQHTPIFPDFPSLVPLGMVGGYIMCFPPALNVSPPQRFRITRYRRRPSHGSLKQRPPPKKQR